MPDVVQPSSFAESDLLWLGVPNVSKSMLKRYDPAYTGNVHIFVVKTPPILTSFYKETHGMTFKPALQGLTTSASGIPELTLNSLDQTQGYSDRKFPHPTYSEMNFDQITFRILDFKGLPVYTMIRDWIECISDPITKIKDYKGRAADITGGYTIENHTCSFIICNADPTNTMIQGRAHYITAAYPTGIPNNHYEWSDNTMDLVGPHDVSFKGILRWGDTIDAKAAALLKQRNGLANYYRHATDGNTNYAADIVL